MLGNLRAIPAVARNILVEPNTEGREAEMREWLAAADNSEKEEKLVREWHSRFYQEIKDGLHPSIHRSTFPLHRPQRDGQAPRV